VPDAVLGVAVAKPITGSKATKRVASTLRDENFNVVMVIPEAKRNTVFSKLKFTNTRYLEGFSVGCTPP
jgi:predicted CoA-binding protein